MPYQTRIVRRKILEKGIIDVAPAYKSGALSAVSVLLSPVDAALTFRARIKGQSVGTLTPADNFNPRFQRGSLSFAQGVDLGDALALEITDGAALDVKNKLYTIGILWEFL